MKKSCLIPILVRKQQKRVFSQEDGPIPDLPLTLDKITIQICTIQKHLALFLDSKFQLQPATLLPMGVFHVF